MLKKIRIFVRTNKKYIVVIIPIMIIMILIVIKLIIVSNNKTEFEEEEELDTINLIDTNDEYYYVDIKGCIKNPGVYKLIKGSRVKDVIELAGGLTSDSDTSNINLAKIIEDEMVININSINDINGNNSYNSNSTNTSGLININTASLEQLMTLSSIGESKAKSIISYREENGNFKVIEEITNVSGIGQALYEKIKDYITV